MKKKKPTIKDIAKLANVSPTAVSMALHHHPRISSKTREAILQIAAQLNYRPNIVARSLVSNKSNMLGLIITTITNPFYVELANGVQDKACELGYDVIFCNTNGDIGLERHYIHQLQSKGVDGIILSTVEIDDPNIKGLLEESFPFICVLRRPYAPEISEKTDYIVVDNETGAYMAMEHIVKLGHRRIAILAGSNKSSVAVERTRGALRLFDDYQLHFDPKLLLPGNFSKDTAYQVTKKLLSLKNIPTAIFSQNDIMALGAREAILEADLKIPEDIALIGFDNIKITRLKGIDLTTVSQKKYEMGAMAVNVLVDKIEKKTPPITTKITLDPELIIRKSCGFHARGGYPSGAGQSPHP